MNTSTTSLVFKEAGTLSPLAFVMHTADAVKPSKLPAAEAAFVEKFGLLFCVLFILNELTVIEIFSFFLFKKDSSLRFQTFVFVLTY